MGEYRAGGHVDRGDGRGWVVEDTPAPAEPEPEPEPAAEEEQEEQEEQEEPQSEQQPEVEADAESEPEPEGEAPSSAEVRVWAREQGIDVARGGPVPKEVVDQYLNRET